MGAIDERSIAGLFEIDEGNSTVKLIVYLVRTVAVVEAVFGALSIGWLSWGVWEGVQTHQWPDLHELAPFPLIIMVFLPWMIEIGWFPWRTISTAVGRLWQAAAEGNDALAPMAEMQPDPLEDVPDARDTLTPLRGIADSSRVGNYWKIGILFGVLGLVLGGLSLILGYEVFVRAIEYGDDGWRLPGVAATVTLMLMSLAGVFYGIRWPILGRRLGRGLSVISDETGLTWRDTRRHSGKRHVAWSEVEACITIACESSEPPTRVYAVKAGRTTLLWSVTPSMSPQEHVASDRLLRLVVTRTGLPVRDLTTIIRAAADEALLVDAHVLESLLRGKRAVAPAPHFADTSTPLDALLPHGFIAAYVRKKWRVLTVSLCVTISCGMVLFISRVVSWFWSGIP